MTTKQEMPEATPTKRQYVRPEVRHVRLDPNQAVLQTCSSTSFPDSINGNCKTVTGCIL